jgi:hypothetical protein
LLEDNVEQNLLREEEALNAGDDKRSSQDTASLQKALKEQKVKFEVCLLRLHAIKRFLFDGRRNLRKSASA